MHPRIAVLALCISVTSASYLSSGWTPGQTPTSTVIQQSIPTQPTAPTSQVGFDWFSLLETGPINKILTWAGVNITEQLAVAREQGTKRPWDERIPLITDDNFHDLIVNEKMDWDEEKNRVWFIVITMGMVKEPLSRFFDEKFDGAYNISLENKDTPNVRWGRIDYLNVTEITTKWGVWKAPLLVVVHDRGRTLRFYRPGEIRATPDMLYRFIKEKGWEETEPWSGPFAPGGSLEHVMDTIGTYLTWTYKMFVSVPRWIFLVLSGTVASFVINLLHSRSKAQQPRRKFLKPGPAEYKNLDTSAVPVTQAKSTTFESSQKQNLKKKKASKH